MARGWVGIVLAASLATLPVASAAPASARPKAPTIAPAAGLTTTVATAASAYLPGTIVIREGDELTFINVDAARHSVTSKTTDDEGVAVFDSGILGFAGQAIVGGVASLKAGAEGYAFFCQMHPWMQGSLIVL